jgi:hypothetical protein
MADVTFQVNDEHLQRFIDGIAGHFGYQDEIDGEPNPETKAQYGKRKMRQQMILWVKRYERQVIEAEAIDIT